MYRWFVEYATDEGGSGIIKSPEKWDARWKAENNLDARLNAHPPNVALPERAFVVDFGVEEVWS